MAVSNFKSLVVREHRPWRTGVLTLVTVTFILASCWLSFEFGRVHAGFDRIEVQASENLLRQEIDQLKKREQGLRERSAVMERSSQIDRQANTVVQGSVKEMQAEMLELKEGLAFYRNIVSPDQSKVGIRIQSLKLVGGGPQRLYRYTLMLTQVLNNKRTARGAVDIVIDGLQNGAPARLSLKDVKTSARAEVDFGFKYFQSLEGEFKLPTGFEARTVTVDAKPVGKRLTRVTKTLEWSATGAAG